MVEPESRTVAEFRRVVFVHESDYTSDAVVAWGCGSSFDVEFEPRVGFGFAASEAEGMVIPFEETQGTLDTAQLWAIAEEPEPLRKPELDEHDLFAVGMLVEGPLPYAGRWPDFVVLVGVSIAVMETEPGYNPQGKVEVVL